MWACGKLQYEFSDAGLLEQALTHRSKGGHNYERLEFLGDSILNFIIAEELFDRFPETKEGTLSRLRASLVQKDTLAVLARELALGDHLLLGGGELKSGGYNRDSILADALEAIIGAVSKDGGLEAARAFVLRIFSEKLARIHPTTMRKDPKTSLQELLQKRGAELPVYKVIHVRGEPHAQHFVVECSASGLPEPVVGEGRSRRNAEQEAASKAYAALTGGHE